MSRFFSSAARKLLAFVWKGTAPVVEYERTIEYNIARNPKLSDAETVEIAGQPHTSKKDTKMRVSGKILNKNKSHLTSVHAYEDGTVVYSKDAFNESQED